MKGSAKHQIAVLSFSFALTAIEDSAIAVRIAGGEPAVSNGGLPLADTSRALRDAWTTAIGSALTGSAKRRQFGCALRVLRFA